MKRNRAARGSGTKQKQALTSTKKRSTHPPTHGKIIQYRPLRALLDGDHGLSHPNTNITQTLAQGPPQRVAGASGPRTLCGPRVDFLLGSRWMDGRWLVVGGRFGFGAFSCGTNNHLPFAPTLHSDAAWFSSHALSLSFMSKK